MNPTHKRILILEPNYKRKRNLLTPNQQTGTDTTGDTTGFEKYKGNEAISSSDEQAHTGTKSLKVITTGNQAEEGIYTTTTATTTNTPYTAGAWVYAPTGQQMTLLLYQLGGAVSTTTKFTGTGTWQYITANLTTNTNYGLRIYIYTASKSATTFYVDDLNLNQIR